MSPLVSSIDVATPPAQTSSSAAAAATPALPSRLRLCGAPTLLPLLLLALAVGLFAERNAAAAGGAGGGSLMPSPLSLVQHFTAERTAAARGRAASSVTHIAFTLCGGAGAGSKTAGSPGPTAVKSVLLSALMQRGDAEVAAGLGGRLHLHLVMDELSASEWASATTEGAEGGGAGPFADSATLLRRHPKLFEVTTYSPEEVWRMAKRGLQAEARERGLDEPPFSEADVDENAWKRCAGLRLLFPIAFAGLGRFVYLDFDTVTMCDAARFGELFDEFEGAACLGFAGEDPSGGKWPSW